MLQFSTVGLFYRSLEAAWARLYFPAPFCLWLLAMELWLAQLFSEESIREAVESAALLLTVPIDPVLV
jgi:hypothetical protein